MVSAELYPFESHYLDIGGLRYHYLDEGQGEPVVMVHGNPTWSFYYRDLVRALRGRCRTIAPDHIGCGLSDKPPAGEYDYRLDRRVDDLAHLLDHLEIRENITLVVHDWGGMIGLAYAIRHPERIKRLVVLNTAAFHLPRSKGFPRALRLCRDTALGGWLVLRFNAFCRAATRVCVKRRPLPAAVRQAYLAPYDSPANRVAVLQFVRDIPLAPEDRAYATVSLVQERLSAFSAIPVLICWGMKDFVFSHHFLTEWQNRLPNAEVHAFADAGHYVLEDAADEVIALVEAFLARYPLGVEAA